MAVKISAKRIAIDKTNTSMVVVMAIASFVTIFSLVAIQSLLSQRSYQAQVIDKKEKSRDQVNSNIKEVEKLRVSYDSFKNQSPNVLGGDPKGTGERDGDNPRLMIDALPAKYDYPALLSSIEKVLADNKYTIKQLEGKDDEQAQASNTSSTSPQPVEMPFTVTISASGASGKSILDLFERSIRPMQVTRVKVQSENANEPKITIEAKSFYQPAKNFNIKTETVK